MRTYLHPGVYIEEIPSGAKPIEGVSTSTAAFIGFANRGPIGEPVLIQSWDDYVDRFGGVTSPTDAMGLAVNAFYLNGGRSAYIARLAANAQPARLPEPPPATVPGRVGGAAADVNVLQIQAASPGVWGNELHIRVTQAQDLSPPGDAYHFRLEVGRLEDGRFVADEIFDGLSMDESDPNYVLTVVNGSSERVRVDLSEALKSDPNTYYLRGTCTSGDLGGLDWTQVHEGMQLTLNIDNLGARTITLGPPPDGAYSDGEEVCAEIQARVRALGPESGYQGFTCTFDSGVMTLASGSRGSASAVVVRPGPLAELLELGPAYGGTEVRGSLDVVPRTSGPAALTGGEDGDAPGVADYQAFFAKLKKIRDASILVLPGEYMPADGSGNPKIDAALAHAEETKNRMVIIDPPPGVELDQAAKVNQLGLTTSTYAALYYPWVKVNNPFYNVDTNPTAPVTLTIAPSAFAAGVWARTDGTRGVWKAPAGVETGLRGVAGLEFAVGDGDQDQLNPLGVNALRKLPTFGPVVWGTRTLSTRANPEWRYVPVRRTAIFIEESIYGGIQWAVFEPNDHRLWSSLRANIGSFMDGLFRSGAFQGETASDAYFVRCGLGDTMTQGDIDRGQVIVIVGFAPLKPAEFVIVRIQQKVAQQ